MHQSIFKNENLDLGDLEQIIYSPGKLSIGKPGAHRRHWWLWDSDEAIVCSNIYECADCISCMLNACKTFQYW